MDEYSEYYTLDGALVERCPPCDTLLRMDTCTVCSGTGWMGGDAPVFGVYGQSNRRHAVQIRAVRDEWFDDRCIGHGETSEQAVAQARAFLNPPMQMPAVQEAVRQARDSLALLVERGDSPGHAEGYHWVDADEAEMKRLGKLARTIAHRQCMEQGDHGVEWGDSTDPKAIESTMLWLEMSLNCAMRGDSDKMPEGCPHTNVSRHGVCERCSEVVK